MSTPVLTPDGSSVRMIPNDQVDAAVSAGGKKAIKMTMGSDSRWIPLDQVGEASKAGARPAANTATAPAAAPQKPGFIQSLGQALGAPTTPEAAAHLISDNGKYPETVGDWVGAPINVLENIGKGISSGVRGGVQQVKEALHNVREGGPILPNIGKAASGYAGGLSSVNPVVAAGGTAGSQVAEGNYRGAAGSLTGGLLTGMTMGSSTSEVRPTRGNIPTPAAVEMITNAVNPIAKEMPKFRNDLATNLDTIVDHAKQNGIDWSSREGLAHAVKSAADQAHTEFSNILEPIKNADIAPPSGFQGATYGTEGRTTLGSLYARLGDINATLNPKYAKGGQAAQAAIDSIEASKLTAEAASIRQTLYSEMGQRLNLPPTEIARLNQRSGSMRDLADTVRFYTDEAIQKENAAKQAPIDIHATAAGIAGRAINKGVNAVRGSVADRMIKAVSDGYSGRPQSTLTPSDPPQFPGAPNPRNPVYRGQPDTTQPFAQVQEVDTSATRGRANINANVRARRAEVTAEAVRQELKRKQANRASHGKGWNP